MSLEGKVALITGASRGIGRQIALELARQMAKIGVHYFHSEEGALSAVEEIRQKGGEALALQGTIREEQAIANIFSGLLDRFGKIDILVCNAGITRDRPLLRMEVEDFDEVIQTNLRGTFLCLKEGGRQMLRNKYGRVIVISSVVGLTGNIGQAAYAASKAGIIALTKTFAREFARWDITANVVAPGLIDTGMYGQIPEEVREKILPLIPKRRPGTAEEVAKLVAFLASDEARYITGQVYCMDGGMVML